MPRVSAVLLFAGLSAAPAAFAAPLPITELGVLGGTQTFALDVNESRVVTGNAQLASTAPAPRLNAFVWGPSAPIAGLGVLPGSNNFSRGYGINDAGVIVGESDNNSSRAFRWESGVMTQLPGLQGPTSGAVAHDINNAGAIVGASSNGAALRPVIWRSGVVADLGVPATAGTPSGRAWSINAGGVVAGNARRADGAAVQPHRWIPDGLGGYTPSALGPLGSDGNRFGEALAIADNGWIAGYFNSSTTGTAERGFLWREGVGYLTMPTLGKAHARATAVNANGIVAGWAGPFAGFATAAGTEAWIWDNGVTTRVIDLIDPASGWTAIFAVTGINDQNDIIGWGTFNGQTRSFIMTIPSPGGAGLLAFAGVLAARRRRGASST